MTRMCVVAHSGLAVSTTTVSLHRKARIRLDVVTKLAPCQSLRYCVYPDSHRTHRASQDAVNPDLSHGTVYLPSLVTMALFVTNVIS
jgi:hypothetical protein